MSQFLSSRSPVTPIAGLTALFLVLSAATAAAQDKIQRWHDSLDRGVEAARKSGRPLFVVFRCVR
jgi:hypothetical protein